VSNTTTASKQGLGDVGLDAAKTVHWNLSGPALYEHTVRSGLGIIAADGPLVVDTTPYTGRSPNDKFIVKHGEVADRIAWGSVNQPVEPAVFQALLERVRNYLVEQTLYVQDVNAGAHPDHRLPIRLVTECPWAALFAQNMFIEITSQAELSAHRPEFTIIHAPFFQAEPERDGTRSEAFVMIDFSQRTVLIGGTKYAGEIKKSIFSVLNLKLPLAGVLSMHCSANVGQDGDTALFFGLSGTGKTTISPGQRTRHLLDDAEVRDRTRERRRR